MISLHRTYSALLLALSLILTGQAMTVAHGAPGPAGQVVLCTGTGPALVYVDENGQPTDPPIFCPDCAPGTLTGVLAPVVSVSFTLYFSPAIIPPHDVILRCATLPDCANARAPPVAV